MGKPRCGRCGFSPRRRHIHLIPADVYRSRWLCRYRNDCAARRRAADEEGLDRVTDMLARAAGVTVTEWQRRVLRWRP